MQSRRLNKLNQLNNVTTIRQVVKVNGQNYTVRPQIAQKLLKIFGGTDIEVDIRAFNHLLTDKHIAFVLAPKPQVNHNFNMIDYKIINKVANYLELGVLINNP